MRNKNIYILRLSRFLIASFICIVFQLKGYAQFYPFPGVVDGAKEHQLLFDLKFCKQGKQKVQLLLTLGRFYISKPLDLMPNQDKAMFFASEALNLSIKLGDSSGYNDAQFLKAYLHAKKNEMKEAQDILSLVNDSTRIGIMLTLCDLYINRVFEEKDDKTIAMHFAQQAVQLSKAIKRPDKEIDGLLYITVIDLVQGKNEQARTEIKILQQKSEKTHFYKIYYVYHLMGRLNMNQGNLSQALYYSTETLKSMKAANDTVAMGDIYIWQAILYYYTAKYQGALDFAQLAIGKYLVHPGTYTLWDLFCRYAQILSKTSRTKDANTYILAQLKKYPLQNFYDEGNVYGALGYNYKDMGNYEQAEKYNLQMFNVHQVHHLLRVDDYKRLGEMYVQDKKYSKAKPYVLKGLTFIIGDIELRSYMHYLAFLCDSATGDYFSAIKHLDINKKLDDSVYHTTRTKELQELQIKYDVEKKESSLKIKDQNIKLLNQKAKLQQADLGKALWVRNVTVAGILFLLICGGALTRQFRYKQKIFKIIDKKNEVITQKNETLERLVIEKEWLLKEVNHRVKNNLHMVISLLESQAMYLDNDDALKAMETSKHRIFSMSLIHQKLYQSEDVKTIDMSIYLPEFVNYLRDSFEAGKYIHFNLEVEPVQLSIAQAIPLALVLNEAITNSAKYAFPGNRLGEISIKMWQTGENIGLIIMDNGIGMAKATEEIDSDSLGLKLMRGLVEEISGQIQFESNNGTIITITFKTNLLVELEK